MARRRRYRDNGEEEKKRDYGFLRGERSHIGKMGRDLSSI